jgi:hypothetical protein
LFATLRKTTFCFPKAAETQMMTRRSAIAMALGLGSTFASRAWAGEFWMDKKPSEWNESEIQRMLSKSPWAKEASIFDVSGYRAPPAMRRAGNGNRRGRTSGGGPSGPTAASNTTTWKAIVRWESALPVRDALRHPRTPAMEENYVIALIGDIPASGIPTEDDNPGERQLKMAALRENTRIERGDDPLNLQQVGVAPGTGQFPGGTLYYFSRAIPIHSEDKQVTFVTKIGPLEVKCKFALRDMMYRSNVEL